MKTKVDLQSHPLLLQARTVWYVAGAERRIPVPKIEFTVTDNHIFCPGVGGALAFSSIVENERWIFMNVGWRSWGGNLLYEVFLHELGHLWKPNWTHSNDIRDVMYPVVDGRKTRLTDRDANWLKA